MVTHPLKDFVVRYQPGEVVYREGDAGAEMFIVQLGSVQIVRTIGGIKQVLAVMEKGDFFGEVSILEGTNRSATAEVLEEAELIEINSTVFDRMIRSNIEIAVRMLRKLSGRLRESNRRLEETLLSAGKEKAAPVDLDRPTEGAREVPAQPADDPAATEKAAAFGPDWAGALILGEGEQVFPIRGETSFIGRFDPVTGTRPEIDLTRFDTNRSVSRRHARVVCRDGGLFVSEEVGALNGTFVNGKRLTPGNPEPIRDGDLLALGMVTLRFQGREPGGKIG